MERHDLEHANAVTTAPPPIDPTQAALLGALRQLLLAVGVLLAGHGVIGPNDTITPDNWQFIVGLILAIAPVAWSWYEKIQAAKTAKERETVAVQAGISLVTSGAALATDGSLIKTSQSAPTLPVTPESAQTIIKSADDLNALELSRIGASHA